VSRPQRESAHDVALSIARCPQLPVAAADMRHSCSQIVRVQEGQGELRHVPEPWAGDLEKGRILFVSSNPSLSEAGVDGA
jgi:hypothetical protein